MPSREEFFAAPGSLPAAVALLTALRWPVGVTCPHCGSSLVGGHGRYRRCRDLPRYRCKAKVCGRTFMLTTGTPLARSRLPLPEWVVTAHKGEPESSPNPRKPEAEATRGRKRGLRHGPGRGHADKDRPVVFLLVARGGLRIVEAGARVDQATLRPLFERCVPLSSRVCADSARCYTLLEPIGHQVEQVNHGEGEHTRGDVHENTAECEIRLLQQCEQSSHAGSSFRRRIAMRPRRRGTNECRTRLSKGRSVNQEGREER